jgi:CRISPR-associated protein Cas1
MHKVASAIGVVGLDPYIGFLHSSQYGKPALALDLMEEFRGPVVDSVVITLLNTSALKHDDFVEEAGMFRMTEKGRRTFLEKFEERLNTFIEHPTFGYKATYQKCLELQVRLLAKNLTGEIPTYPPFIVR